MSEAERSPTAQGNGGDPLKNHHDSSPVSVSGASSVEAKEVRVARAYVKINVAAGKEREVRDSLLERDEVRTADLTSGDQDIIALVEANTFDELLDLTLNQLRTIEGVTGTVTNLVVDKEDDH